MWFCIGHCHFNLFLHWWTIPCPLDSGLLCHCCYCFLLLWVVTVFLLVIFNFLCSHPYFLHIILVGVVVHGYYLVCLGSIMKWPALDRSHSWSLNNNHKCRHRHQPCFSVNNNHTILGWVHHAAHQLFQWIFYLKLSPIDDLLQWYKVWTWLITSLVIGSLVQRWQ